MKRSLLLALPLVFSAATAAVARPNVVMIVADDQAFTDFGFMGNNVVRTPHLDRLAKQSARYTAGPNRYVDRMALFDVDNDPGETVDLSGESDCRDDIERLTKLLDQWWRAGDD